MSGRRVYRIGWRGGYVLGPVLMVAGVALAVPFTHAEYLRPDDRIAMAVISAATLGGLGVVCIMRAAVPRVLIERERLCVRTWCFFHRCIDLDRIEAATWSFNYAWPAVDRGHAWLELDLGMERGRPRIAVIDYGGQARHAQLAELVQQMALRARLRPDGPPPEAELARRSGSVTWERAR